MRKNFWSENLKGRDHSEALGVDGKISESILGKLGRKVWMHVAQNMDRRWDLVNTVTNFRGP
jgi:hypothetical protein